MKNLLLILAFITIQYTLNAQVVTPQQINEHALKDSFAKQEISPLALAYDKVDAMDLNLEQKQYWLAQNLYQQAIYSIKNGETKTSKSNIEKSIYKLKSIENKDDEDYVLLAMMQAFSMQFKSNISELQDAEELFYSYIDKALQLNPKNPRIYYVAGIYDANKPVMFGGGQKAKEYFSKAEELFKDEQYEPTWGFKNMQKLME